MKFARLLRSSSASIPEMSILFECYKNLKKELKHYPPGILKQQSPQTEEQASEEAAEAAAGKPLTADEQGFIKNLDSHLVSFNESWLEKEETVVIKLHELEEAAKQATTPGQKQQAYRELVDFHGEVLLMLHWSILAYTSLVKILKKHHKRTGLLLRAPHLQNIFAQPFCSTEVMQHLLGRTEEAIMQISKALRAAGAGSSGAEQAARAAEAAAAAGDDGKEGGSKRGLQSAIDESADVHGRRVRHRQDAAEVGDSGAEEAAYSGAGLGSAEAAPLLQGLPQLASPCEIAVVAADLMPSDSDDELEEPDGAPADAEAARDEGGGGGGEAATALRGRCDADTCQAVALRLGESEICKQARVALGTWEQLRESAASPSTHVFSAAPACPPGLAVQSQHSAS